MQAFVTHHWRGEKLNEIVYFAKFFSPFYVRTLIFWVELFHQLGDPVFNVLFIFYVKNKKLRFFGRVFDNKLIKKTYTYISAP